MAVSTATDYQNKFVNSSALDNGAEFFIVVLVRWACYSQAGLTTRICWPGHVRSCDQITWCHCSDTWLHRCNENMHPGTLCFIIKRDGACRETADLATKYLICIESIKNSHISNCSIGLWLFCAWCSSSRNLCFLLVTITMYNYFFIFFGRISCTIVYCLLQKFKCFYFFAIPGSNALHKTLIHVS